MIREVEEEDEEVGNLTLDLGQLEELAGPEPTSNIPSRRGSHMPPEEHADGDADEEDEEEDEEGGYFEEEE